MPISFSNRPVTLRKLYRQYIPLRKILLDSLPRVPGTHDIRNWCSIPCNLHGCMYILWDVLGAGLLILRWLFMKYVNELDFTAYFGSKFFACILQFFVVLKTIKTVKIDKRFENCHFEKGILQFLHVARYILPKNPPHVNVWILASIKSLWKPYSYMKHHKSFSWLHHYFCKGV